MAMKTLDTRQRHDRKGTGSTSRPVSTQARRLLRTGAEITVVFCPLAERGQTAHGVCLLLFLRQLFLRRSLFLTIYCI